MLDDLLGRLTRQRDHADAEHDPARHRRRLGQPLQSIALIIVIQPERVIAQFFRQLCRAANHLRLDSRRQTKSTS
jgi:hypothetical protein